MGMSEQEVHQAMGEALISRGLATAEQVAADRASLDADIAARTLPMDHPAPTQQQPQAKPSFTADPTGGQRPSIVQESADMAALSAAAFEGPKSPGEYRFDVPPGVDRDLKQEQAMREMFYQHGVPTSLAAELSRQWLKGVMNPPTQQQRDRAFQDGHLQLSKIYGDQVPKVLQIANAELDRLSSTHPQILDMLKSSGLNNSWWLVSNLHSFARAKGRA